MSSIICSTLPRIFIVSGGSPDNSTNSSGMDLANFNNVFADKNMGDAGRREDSISGMQANTTQGHSNNNFDAVQQLLNMQMQFPSMSLPMNVDGSSGSNHGSTSSSTSNAAVLLEQQLRLHQLQQLQQLQNQIFQQQIELISGQANLSSALDSTSMTSNQFQGLPTPANSTELRPQPPPNFASPMMLQNYLAQQGAGQQAGPSAVQFTSPHQLPQGSCSAPAHLAFSTDAPLMSPGDLDFELSPLTSPWLGAASYQQAQQQLQQHSQSQSQRPSSSQFQAQVFGKRRTSKRGASSGDDADGHAQARKARQCPAIRSTIGSGSASSKKAASSRGSGSVSSTPAMRAQKSRRGSIVGEIVGDTPSPVDLSMPPPAPPSQSENIDSSSGASQIHIPANASTSTAGSSSQGSALSPVTPASIMNLGRLGISSGLSSPLVSAEDRQTQENYKAKGKNKNKVPPKPINTSSSAQGKSISKRASSTSLVSPSLKPLLPGGISTSSAVAELGSASNYSHHLSGSASSLHIAPSTSLQPATPAVRKTSHKAAEQKRRDSLKNSFDQLRLLLPPLPSPNEEGYLGAEGERLPPGAMPPRGPPRGDVTGPNRGVSKLMLLRCGNEYIRTLKGRVQRRDEYISDLKREIRALRARVEFAEHSRMNDGGDDGEQGRSDVTGMMDAMAEEIERVDLEKELDAEEENAPRLGLGALAEGGEDADEECE